MKYFLPLLILCTQVVSAQHVSFTAPDTVYVNDPVNVVNTSTDGSSWYWSSQAGDMSGNPVFTDLNPGLGGGQFLEIVRVDTNYYGFLTLSKNLARLSFGNSLLNTPIVHYFGNLYGLMPFRNEGLQIVHDGNGWHVVLVGGEDPVNETTIISVNFGTSIENNFPLVDSWGNIANMQSPIGLYIWKDSSQYYGYITQHDKTSMVLVSFGSSVSNQPTGVDVGNLDDAFWPGGLTVVKRNGNHYMFVANEDPAATSTYWINRINFGSSLLNPAASTYNDLYLPEEVHSPKDVTLFNDNGIDRGYLVNLDPSYLTKFSFPGNDITADSIHVDSVYTMGTLNGPFSITDFLSSGNDLVSFVYNYWEGKLTRVVYPGGSGGSSSILKDPPAFSYSTPGTYKIRLSMDEGLMTQQSIYKDIVVLPQPTSFPDEQVSVFRLYPNPTGGTAYLEVSSKYNAMQYFTVTDLNGRVVYAKQFRVVAGKNRLELILPTALKDGLYLISNGRHSQKLVLKTNRVKS